MASEVGHRGSVVGPTINDCALETVFPGDIMGGYGDFTSQENVSFWSLPYPVGWTNGGWFEHPASWRLNGACHCNDCHGSNTGSLRGQNYPGALVPCTNSIFSFDFWDYAYTPGHHLAVEQPCCSVSCDPSGCSSSSTPCEGYGDPGTNRMCIANLDCVENYESGQWPLVPFAHDPGCSAIRVVEDSSGPAGCLEDYPALEIDLPGHDGGATYVGPGGGFGPTDWDPDNDERTTTGWTIAAGDCWTIDFWVKSVPDADGYDISGSGAAPRARWGKYPYEFAPSIHTFPDFDGTWQHCVYDAHIRFPFPGDSPLLNSPLTIAGVSVPDCTSDCLSAGYTRPFYCRRGRFRVKAVHIYPCDFSSGAWFKRPSGLHT